MTEHTEQLQAITQIIEDTEQLSYSIALTRLIDGVSTYTLTIGKDEKLEFESYSEAASFIRAEQRKRQAQAILDYFLLEDPRPRSSSLTFDKV